MRRGSLRIGVDARLATGAGGGVEQLLIGLASGLSRLCDGDEQYLFLTYRGWDDWIQPHLAGPARVHHVPGTFEPNWRARVVSAVPWATELSARIQSRRSITVPSSDGTIEKANVDVMHFTLQQGFLTEIPSIYQPHDLQHRHLPELFSDYDRRSREVMYRAHCERAAMVATSSSWIKWDVVRAYGISEDKVKVVPLAPPISEYPAATSTALEAIRQKYALPEQFALYPAQTWPHKNHLGLMRALGRLRREHDLGLPLVCSGQLTGFYSEIQRCARAEGISDLVTFLGFVSPVELACLYKLCRVVVIPTRFEAASFPLWEAFVAGAPAACSNVTSLPRQAGGAALIFNPDDPSDIAEALLLLWKDELLRQVLIDRGHARVSGFTWDLTARMFRAHYKRIAHAHLGDDENELLDASPRL